MYTSSMSHWNMPQIEDINWGVFSKTYDHMVPNRNIEPLDRPLFLSDAVVKQQDEVTNDFTSTVASKSSAADSTALWKEVDSYHLHIKNGSSSMLQGIQSHASNDVSPIMSDLDKTDTCSTLPSEDVSISDYCVSESNNTDANMLYLTTENSINESKALTCLESQQMERNNELAYHDDMYSGWAGEEDELRWLSSMYGTEIAPELGFQSPNYGFDTNANMEALAESFTAGDCSLNNVQAVTENDNETSLYTFPDCLYAEVSSERNSAIVEEPCNVSSKSVQNTDDCSLNGSGANNVKSENMHSPANNGTQISTAQKILNFNFSTREMYSSAQNQKKKHFLGSSCYMQSSDQNSQLEFNQPMHQVPFTQTTSDIHFDEGTNRCTSYENVRCYEKIPDQSYSSQAIAPKQNIGTVYAEQNIPHRRKIFGKTNDTKMDDAGLENSVTHHSSKIISCIQQLQNVMKQMDPKTKICIRDSLYRLAKSASRRNGFANRNCSEAIAETNGIHDTKTLKRSEEFMDVETSTNPLDRAVAYLLLHDPADSPKSTIPAGNTRALNSKLMEFENQALYSGCSDMETDLP